MEFFLGAAAMLVLFILSLLFYYLGYKAGARQRTPPKMDDKERERIKRFNEGFQNMLNYTVEQAMGRRVKDE